MAISGRKSKEEMYSYLQHLAIAVLSTATPSGAPHAAVIYFMPDENLNFFFLTKSDTKKSENLKKNNNAALTIIDPHSPKTIQATGTVSEVMQPEIYTDMIRRIGEANAKENGFYWPPPLSKLQSEGDLVLYRFSPEWLRFADFSETPGGDNYIFYNVLPENG